MRIERNIHLIFLRRDETIPPLFKKCEEHIRGMHPSWNMVRWDEETGLRNEGWYVELPNGRKETCLFGKYAVHLYAGTWKKEI